MAAEKDRHSVRPLIEAPELARRVTEMAAEIDRDYAGTEGLVVIGVLKGAVFFVTDLTRQLRVPLVLDFFQTSSYGSGTTGGEVRIKRDIESSPDPAARRRELEAKLDALRSPFRTAETFGIEEIIDPRDTRPLLCEWAATAYDLLPAELGPKRRGLRP